MRGMDLNAESEARNNRVERPERGRRARGNSLPRITVRTKRELVARLEKTWMKNVENYWSTLEDECLAAKEWYDYHAQLYLHKSENEILGSGGQAVVIGCAQRATLRDLCKRGSLSVFYRRDDT